ncbi:MAG: DUF1501 domain-containing protein [Planctomycetes bacterium]|nr:DUF1501 domain-containing protein [Planctomycetota bacterium]
MQPDIGLLTRRRFLTSAASGLGAVALASMLRDDGLLAQSGDSDPLRPRPPHFEAKAKACIFIFLIGGISQVDLFDRKPLLQRLHGERIPESYRRGVRLGQTNYNAPLMGARFGFRRYGRCGMEMSELLPYFGSCADDLTLIRSMHHEAFDHAPGELELCTGKDIPGRPTMGSWLIYGLGSESRNLPGYVVLLNGRSPKARSYVWGSGYLPATYQGVLFRNQGSPILNLQTPSEMAPGLHRAQLDAIRSLNELHHEETGDPRVAAQIAAYELAYRMQTAAPELLDLSGETRATIESYGASDFARSLLLARRLVERGVRFVTVTHHEWDHHDGIAAGLPDACRQIDRPIAALLQDLKRRGLLESTLVVGGTEFGRTAITQGNNFANAGRDHHPHAFTIWLAGAGVKRGFTLGETDELCWRVAEDPVHTHDFHATLLHLFGLDHRRLTFRHQGLDMRLTDVAGTVVNKILE